MGRGQGQVEKDILRTLRGSYNWMPYGELAFNCSSSVEYVRKVVKKLEREGLVETSNNEVITGLYPRFIEGCHGKAPTGVRIKQPNEVIRTNTDDEIRAIDGSIDWLDHRTNELREKLEYYRQKMDEVEEERYKLVEYYNSLIDRMRTSGQIEGAEDE